MNAVSLEITDFGFGPFSIIELIGSLALDQSLKGITFCGSAETGVRRKTMAKPRGAMHSNLLFLFQSVRQSLSSSQ